MLKASITARQSAVAPPPIPSNRSTLTWSPVDYPKQIPSWQRPATPTLSAPTTTTSTGQLVGSGHSPPASPDVLQSEEPSQSTPYSQNYLDIMNTVNEHLPTVELNRRLGIRGDINDKPVGDHPITRGTKQPRSKPWEKPRDQGRSLDTNKDTEENTGEGAKHKYTEEKDAISDDVEGSTEHE